MFVVKVRDQFEGKQIEVPLFGPFSQMRRRLFTVLSLSWKTAGAKYVLRHR